MARQMLIHFLFRSKGMLLSATSRNGQPDVNLHPVQNPEHALVVTSKKDQSDANLQSVQNPEHALVSNKQEGPARC